MVEDKGVIILSNSVSEDRDVLQIKEGAFGGTYFRDIYSSVNGKWYKKTWK